MDEDSVLLANIPLPLDAQAILRHLGGKSSAVVADAIAHWREAAGSLLVPRAVYRPVAVADIADGAVMVAGGHAFTSAKLGVLFAGAERLVLTVGTIGAALEDEVSRLFAASEYVDALVLDAIGSVAVEEVCQYVRSRICRRYGDEEGLQVGPSLSPGYQYWDLRDQRVIFDLLPAGEIGVSLTESCLMIPRKSESTATPLGRRLRVTAGEDEPPCRFCDRQDCPARVR